MALGAELVTNGGFDADSDWTKNKWTIAAGVATYDPAVGSGTANLDQAIAITAGLSYQTTFEITARSAGGVRIRIGGESGTTRTTTGIYTEIIKAGSSNSLVSFLATPSSANVSIDDVSVKEITGVTQGFIG
jgi:hypothetical protein